MPSTPQRIKPDGLDFNRPEDCHQILLLDKHTRIEGLCSEAVFMEDVVEGNFSPVTNEFWFSRNRENGYNAAPKYDIRKIITSYEKGLNELDYRILDGFAREKLGLRVSVVHFDSSTKKVREFRHYSGQRHKHPDQQGDLLAFHGDMEIPSIEDRNPVRIHKAADFLEERKLLKDAAIKRLVANCYLPGGAWDIDAFTITAAGQVVAMEVKQKYPTAAKTFGINKGQKGLFDFLTGLGMPVIHIILQKPVSDASVHAIDLLTFPEYRQKTRWLYTRLVPEKLRKAVEAAPASTSINGQHPVEYEHISLSQFSLLKKLGVPATDIRGKLLAGIE
jgi:hypothetical protein